VKHRIEPQRPTFRATGSPIKPALRSGKSKRFGGSEFDAWNDQIMDDTAGALWVK